MTSPLLQGIELHKSFGATKALDGMSVSVDAGEVVAVMGSSGSGKSTLLHCLAGILAPDEGSVVYAGRELGKLPDDERSVVRRDEFGFVFQFGQLVPELTCLENAALPLRLGGTKRKVAERVAAEWLDRLGVAEVAGKRPPDASGGQSQRVAIARAMVTNPRVLFADEPTGALDSLTGERVLRAMTTTAKDNGTAVVLVTHDSMVAAYADREVVVRDGRVRTSEWL